MKVLSHFLRWEMKSKVFMGKTEHPAWVDLFYRGVADDNTLFPDAGGGRKGNLRREYDTFFGIEEL